LNPYDIHLIRVDFGANPPVAEFHSIVELKKDNMNFMMNGWFSVDASNVFILGGLRKLIPEAPNPIFLDSLTHSTSFLAKY
jgi:hypothetical protein